MDRTDNNTPYITLEWNVRSFIQNLPNGCNLQTVVERLNPYSFQPGNDIKDYWSIPERLLDMYWVFKRSEIAYSEEDQPNISEFSSYIKLEHQLFLVVTKIGLLAWDYVKNAIIDLDDKIDLHIYREDNIQFLHSCTAKQSEDASFTFPEEILIKLYELALDVPSYAVSDSRTQDLRDAANKLKKCLNHFASSSIEESLSLLLASQEEKLEITQLAQDFAKKAADYLDNPLWRKDSSSIKALKKVIKNIQKILPDWSPANVSPWTPKYVISIWDGLQDMATSICNHFTCSPTEKLSISSLLDRVEEIIHKLNLQDKVKKTLEEYTRNQKKCVALLDFGSITRMRIFSFSGFQDCTDSEIESLLGITCDSETFNAFRNICTSFHADLACFSKDVVDQIVRYEINSNCMLKKYGPLRNELSPLMPIKFYKKNYSCCERKILAKLAATGKQTITSASLYVKFAPCTNCFGALRDWINAGKINFMLDYPSALDI